MKSKLLTILAALAFLLSAPLAAQLPEESQPAPDAHIEDIDRELDGDVEVEYDSDRTNVSAEAQFDEDAEFDAEYEARELPQTASPLPLLALLGAGSMVTALGLRFSRRK